MCTYTPSAVKSAQYRHLRPFLGCGHYIDVLRLKLCDQRPQFLRAHLVCFGKAAYGLGTRFCSQGGCCSCNEQPQSKYPCQ